MKSNRNNIRATDVIEDYVNNKLSVQTLSIKYKTTNSYIRDILENNNIPRRSKYLNESKGIIEKYTNPPEGFHYIARSKTDGKEFDDYMNKSGCLTNYIKNVLGEELPSLYKRHAYFIKTQNYWYEQWFDIVLQENAAPQEVKKCPYCEWSTIDINNRSGVFEQHLKKDHNMTVEEHLQNHPEDKEYFTNQVCSTRRMIHETNEDKFVTCQICGQKMTRIDWKHLDKHGITLAEYKAKYGTDSTISKCYKEHLQKQMKAINIALEEKQDKFSSKAETEIKEFIQSYGIECSKNRSILEGKELDIFIPSHRLAIEYNGNLWHNEEFGHKDENYHNGKLEACKAKGINLIQIFEDEYVYKKDIVLNKIKALLKIQDTNKKILITENDCDIHEINQKEADDFIDANTICGKSSSDINIGAYYKDELIGSLCFTNKETWIIDRVATALQYACSGVAKALLDYFIINYKPNKIIAYSDRRWETNENNNFYTKNGFTINQITKPDFKYFISKLDRCKRYDKGDAIITALNDEDKKKLNKIWDCGKYEYIWKSK